MHIFAIYWVYRYLWSFYEIDPVVAEINWSISCWVQAWQKKLKYDKWMDRKTDRKTDGATDKLTPVFYKINAFSVFIPPN